MLVFGSLGALVALTLVAVGIAFAVASTQRDDDGFFTTPSERFSTSAYALTYEDLHLAEIADTPDWVVDRIGALRIKATSPDGTPLFVGVAREADVDRYLAGIAHDEVVRASFGSFGDDEIRGVAGGALTQAPGHVQIWVASATGRAPTVDWKVADGDWAVVVMDAEGARGVTADVELGANGDWLLAAGVIVGGIGLAVGAGAVLLLAFGLTGGGGGGGAIAAPGGGPGAVAGATEPVATTYPVAVEARLDEPLSRWLWLVKFVLVIPHAIVLAFLWLAVVVLTVVAFFAILFTGRYPRTIFDFNLGVMRWTWRVEYYAYGGLGTDQYPPFSLGAEPEYPATLDIPYPDRLSRGLVLVKSWLLAIPHLIVVAIFAGGITWGWTGGRIQWPGLIALLAFVAGVVLLLRGRYPREIFELVVGLNRWVWRVVAYVALMRDEYPPFRIGR